jgi:hypothetical protein
MDDHCGPGRAALPEFFLYQQIDRIAATGSYQ